ncbi:transposase, partial [Lacihabitans sp. LS3-19]|nr:transposase [Lacihabitans sp. LS3-19]
PSEYEGDKLESKGFFDEETVRDFPLRGKPCFLKIKRRKWLNHNSGKIVYRNWEIVANGTRMTTEFATFLKGAFR